jgi:hypothetical protein
MSEIVKTPTQAVQPSNQTDATHTKTGKKGDAHRHHHHHSHRVISPVPSGTPHLNPGSIRIG